jgi:hypothetical protein
MFTPRALDVREEVAVEGREKQSLLFICVDILSTRRTGGISRFTRPD